MITIYNAKKTFKGTVTIGGVLMDWRAMWNVALQEFKCNVKLPSDKWATLYEQEYFTDHWQDAKGTLEAMAELLAVRTIKAQ